MLNCSQCGFQNSDTSGFCTSCGNALTMAHLIQDEANIADLIYRMNRLEAVLQELMGKPVADQVGSPSGSIGEEAELVTLGQTSDIVGDLVSEEYPPASVVSQTGSKTEDLVASTERLMEESAAEALFRPVVDKLGVETGTSSPSIFSSISRLDRVLGSNWLAVAGGIFLVTSMGLLSFFVITSIPPLAKFIFALSLGIAALGLGEVSRRKYGLLSNVITGSGLSIIYIATFAAFTLGAVIPDQLGFGLLLVISFLGWFLAVRSDNAWVALLGTTGTFITPFVLRGYSEVDIPILMVVAYLVIADIAVALISLTKRWVLLKQISLWASYLFLFVVFATEPLEAVGLWSELASFSAIYALFLCVSVSYHWIWKVQADFKELLLVVGNSVLFYVALLTLLSGADTYGFGIANILLASVNAALSVVFWFRGGNREFQLLFAAKSAAFAMATIPVLLDGEIVTSIWAGMALCVWVLGQYLADVRWQLYSVILFGLSLGKFWVVDVWVSTDYQLFALVNDRVVTGVALSGILWMAWFSCQRLGSMSAHQGEMNQTTGPDEVLNSMQMSVKFVEVKIKALFAEFEASIPRIFATTAFATVVGVGVVHLGQTPIIGSMKNLHITWAVVIVGGVTFCFATIRRSHWFVLLATGLLLGCVLKMPFDLVVSSGVWTGGQIATGYFISTIICTVALVVAVLFFRRWFRPYSGVSELLLLISNWEIRFVPGALILSCLGVVYLGLGMELFSQWDKAITGIFGYLPSLTMEMYQDVLLLMATVLMGVLGIGTVVAAARLNDYVNVQFFYKIIAVTLVNIALVKLVMVDGMVAQGKLFLSNLGQEGFVPFLNVYIVVVVVMLAITAVFVRIGKLQSWDTTTVDHMFMEAVKYFRKFGMLICLSEVALVFLVVVSREILVSGLHIDVERIVLSVYWLLYALAFVALGIRWKMAKMRLVGFGLLVVPVAKTFLYDVWVIHPFLGFTGMFVMGSMLLGMSFVYQRNRERIQSFLFERAGSYP
jgi:hypothetical protein